VQLQQLRVGDAKDSFRVVLTQDLFNFSVQISDRLQVALLKHAVDFAHLVQFGLDVLPKLHNKKILKHLVRHDIPSLGEFVQAPLIWALGLEKWVHLLALGASLTFSCQLLVLLVESFLHSLFPAADLVNRGVGVFCLKIHLLYRWLFGIGAFVVLGATLEAEVRCGGKQQTATGDACPLVLNDFLFLFVKPRSWEMCVLLNMCVNLIKDLVG
jgi:hypothetical protein